MRKKYGFIINNFLKGDSRTQIFRETPDLISLGLKNMDGQTIYMLQETVGKIVITYTCESLVFGKIQKQWVFDAGMNQAEIYNRVQFDIEVEVKKMMSKIFTR